MWNSKWLTESAFGYTTFDDTWQGQETLNSDAYYRGMMSQSVVLECQQDSEVWLEASESYCYVYGTSRQSVFGGFILQRL